ncbi:ferritin-like domain-containing protein [Halobaculum sp. CBA1158]|uniref:ferritin-like domain-containing protein n=1 Tax=Halobaculum sp. CBA1158 TaxID=2904243 RepID=UPI001F1F6526|nr:ferritin-like domain-containing protein [Halobaculum sp. CBA1158]UIP00973.1 ferritin-like domain-containing protein [Halobaculum sp. CBA1158]
MTANDYDIDDRVAGIDAAENGGDGGGSRRRFLSRSAIAGGALLALGSGAGLSLAQEDGEDTEEEEGPLFDDEEGTDVDVLNYALTLEHLENAFYRTGIEMFDAADFLESDATIVSTEEDAEVLYENLQTIGDHEAAHVDLLTQVVELLGGTPVEEAEYDFGIEDVAGFMSLASTLENTGVAAYAGAAPAIESPDLLRTALGVHSVEARHAAVVTAAGGDDPYPDAVDEPAAQSDVLSAVGPLIVDESDDEGEGEEGDEGDGAEDGHGENGDGSEGDDGESGSSNSTATDTPNGDGS